MGRKQTPRECFQASFCYEPMAIQTPNAKSGTIVSAAATNDLILASEYPNPASQAAPTTKIVPAKKIAQ